VKHSVVISFESVSTLALLVGSFVTTSECGLRFDVSGILIVIKSVTASRTSCQIMLHARSMEIRKSRLLKICLINRRSAFKVCSTFVMCFFLRFSDRIKIFQVFVFEIPCYQLRSDRNQRSHQCWENVAYKRKISLKAVKYISHDVR
jgi:hypothetical protein